MCKKKLNPIDVLFIVPSCDHPSMICSKLNVADDGLALAKAFRIKLHTDEEEVNYAEASEECDGIRLAGPVYLLHIRRYPAQKVDQLVVVYGERVAQSLGEFVDAWKKNF